MTRKENMKENMKNVSFPIYKDTHERYLAFKRENELTHNEALNLLLDQYKENEEEVEENDKE